MPAFCHYFPILLFFELAFLLLLPKAYAVQPLLLQSGVLHSLRRSGVRGTSLFFYHRGLKQAQYDNPVRVLIIEFAIQFNSAHAWVQID